MENLMKVKELADYLQVTKSIVYRLARAGKIPSYKIGNRFRFDRKEVLLALKAKTTQSNE